MMKPIKLIREMMDNPIWDEVHAVVNKSIIKSVFLVPWLFMHIKGSLRNSILDRNNRSRNEAN
jgi:hypothetical protein